MSGKFFWLPKWYTDRKFFWRRGGGGGRRKNFLSRGPKVAEKGPRHKICLRAPCSSVTLLYLSLTPLGRCPQPTAPNRLAGQGPTPPWCFQVSTSVLLLLNSRLCNCGFWIILVLSSVYSSYFSRQFRHKPYGSFYIKPRSNEDMGT